MKNIILILIFILGSAYYFVPNETKDIIFEKIGIQGNLLKQEVVKESTKGELVKLYFDKDRKASYNGNLSSGIVIENKWASQPYVKCFYEKDYVNFNGNVVLHRINLPKNKTISVKLTKSNPESNINIYLYKTLANNDVFPPVIEYVYDCTIDVTNEIIKTLEMKGNTAPSDIIIGVSGADGLLEGGYKIDIQEK